MLELSVNRALNRYLLSALLTSLSGLFLFGCSTTPDSQTLQRSIASSPVHSSVPTVASSMAPEGLENRTIDDELPQIQPPNGKYILGSGDVVTVTVWGHPELSGQRTVGPDGEIQLPFVGSFRVAGLNADDASSKLTSALREDYLNTAASLTVDKYNSNQVIVLGHVEHQGVLTFANTPTLLEALAMAGTAPGKDVQGGMPVRCAIIRGRDSVMWVDLHPLMKGTDVSLNIPLHRNDLV